MIDEQGPEGSYATIEHCYRGCISLTPTWANPLLERESLEFGEFHNEFHPKKIRCYMCDFRSVFLTEVLEREQISHGT